MPPSRRAYTTRSPTPPSLTALSIGRPFVSSEWVIELAGFEVADELILELAGLLQRAGYDETAERLTYALKWGDELVGLRIADRLAILDVLDDAPEAFADLRGVLTSEHRWRIRHGLV